MDGNLLCLGGVGVIFALAGLFAGYRAVMDWRRFRKSQGWVPAAGRILYSNVFVQSGTPGDRSYQVSIAYTYQVMGQSYQGNQLAFGSEGTGYSTRSAAENVAARYPAGSEVTIYYDPEDPVKAVLERKYNPVGATLSVIFGLAGLGMIIFSYLQ